MTMLKPPAGSSPISSLSVIKSAFSEAMKTRRWLIWMLVAGIGVLLLSITESIATPATTDLASSGTWSTALAYSVPIMMAGMGGLFAERAGIVNIGLEGMLILGTWFGAWGALEFGSWWGIIIGIIGGGLGGLLHAVATVSFGIDHIISGVAINLMAPGIARYLSSEIFTNRPGGGITQSPRVESVDSLDIPILSGGLGGPNVLGRIESWDWFWISDIAGIAHGLTSDLSWATILAYALVPFSIWLLWRTAFGLRIRSCGEHPIAADSLGVNVYKYKYYAVVISGMFAGFGGAFLVIELTGIYRENQTGGRGFIGLATMIFGNWKPVGTALGALLFGFTDTLRLRDNSAIHGLLLTAAMAIGILLIYNLYTKNMTDSKQLRKMAIYTASGIALLVWYLTTENVPDQLPRVIPHITVLFVLLFAATRLRAPAADGMRYRRGME